MTDCKLIGAIIGMMWWLFTGGPRRRPNAKPKK